MDKRVFLYEVWNCHEIGDKATLWIRTDGQPQELEFAEDSEAVRILGPIDRSICEEVATSLRKIFSSLGVRVEYDEVADD